MKALLTLLLAVALAACVTTYPSLDQIQQYESEDQKTLYGKLRTLQVSLNDRDIETWFDLYAENAVITYKKNRPTPKQEVVADMRAQDLSKWTFKITDIKIVSSDIKPASAKIEAILDMDWGGTGNLKKHPETYYFNKVDGKWLISKETNP